MLLSGKDPSFPLLLNRMQFKSTSCSKKNPDRAREVTLKYFLQAFLSQEGKIMNKIVARLHKDVHYQVGHGVFVQMKYYMSQAKSSTLQHIQMIYYLRLKMVKTHKKPQILFKKNLENWAYS
ncbi:Hypothetical_protein [Hexamita inflata]|uniref:Hypothetical_protein n=1 Tax=Hexamita inflata TaxID=28002 RepID=A0AA86TNX6_9EUKA|nr:Hypothetical protein HINF_LOCUS9212 [Hexamita inflata]